MKKYDSFSSIGGYPLYYLDDDNNVLCPDCANKEGMNTQIIASDINWEDGTMYCDDCSKRIHSAYCD